MYDGIINIYKEKGYTSFDVVARLRGILKQKKIGHTGTLDPDAEGVLVICLGKATKLCDILTDKDKRYDAVILLGKTSDTEDSSGVILTESDVDISEEKVRDIIMSFVGEYDQIPPMYSAIKVNGKKLYELARQGVEIDRAPRRVAIRDINITEINLPYVKLSVTCGKGTYIRSLCRDIGEKLGCGGLMESLVRSSVNSYENGMNFSIEEALKLDDVERLVEDGSINDYILSVDKMFPNLMRVKVTEEGSRKLRNGNLLFQRDFISPAPTKEVGIECLVYDCEGVFTAIYRYDDKIHGWKAYKMFV